MNRRLCKLVFSYLLIISLVTVPVVAAGDDTSTVPGDWKPNIHLSISDEHQIMKEAGMNLDSWDKAVEEMKQEGASSSISEEMLKKADANCVIDEEDGMVYHIGRSSLFGAVTDTLEAYRLAYRLVEMLGCENDVWMVLKSKISMNDKTIYSFQQVYDGEEVLGGTLKIAVDGNDEVTAVFSCIDSEKVDKKEYISKAEAESIAISNCDKNTAEPEVFKEFTERIFRAPVSIGQSMNVDQEMDPVPDQLVWVVYTFNESAGEKPYLAHYITCDGTYICNFPVKEPSDEEARGGYARKDIFEGLEADTYTGVITDIYGKEKTVTVPVMRSVSDGCWYLGDVDRRIAILDYREAAYGENHDFVLIKSENNKDWDSQDIYTIYNYIRVRDFYADMGWVGPDGQGTDELIFKGICYSNGDVYSNACALGKIEGWQCFAYAPYKQDGRPTNFTLAFDVMVHEFTHTFTGTVMNQNLYENDMGAINEAMSDIMGNLVELIYGDTEDTTWMLGEHTGSPIRSMTNPEDFGQPSRVWGMYYGPKTDTPNTVNDQGGVHCNSSLLNIIAAKLCTEYGMSYEDAVSFWIMTAIGLTPRTDYIQMVSLLTWAMEESVDDEKYKAALDKLIEETGIESTEFPDSLPKGQKMVMLELPDTEAFQNKDWALFVYQYELKTPADRLWDIFNFFKELFSRTQEETEKALTDFDIETEIDRRIEALQNDQIKIILDSFASTTMDYWIKSQSQIITYEEMDTGKMPAVVKDEPSAYILMNISKGGSQLEKICVFVDGGWLDVTDLVSSIGKDFEINEDLGKLVSRITSYAVKTVYKHRITNFWERLFNNTGGIQIEYVPSTGLENVQLN